MGLINKMKKLKSAIKKSSQVNVKDISNFATYPQSQSKAFNLSNILENISKLNATEKTPRSRVSLVCNFGEYSDFNISFANGEGTGFVLSKGLSVVLRKKVLKSKEWSELPTVSVDDLLVKGFLDFNTRGIVLESKDDNLSRLKHVLISINKWASLNYPVVIGIDMFTYVYGNISLLELLSIVLETNSIRYIFYYRGINYLESFNIPCTDNVGTECPVGFLPEDSKRGGFFNSMIELRNLLQKYDNVNAEIYKEVLSSLNSFTIRTSSTAISEVDKHGMNIFDNHLQKYMWPTDKEYRMGYCLDEGGIYVPFNHNLNRFITDSRYVLVTKDTQLMLNGELLSCIQSINIASCEMPQIKWVDGVPGSGKTKTIVKQHKPGHDLILCQTKASVKEVRDRVKDLLDATNKVERLKLDYRTVSSFIINGSDRKYKRVFIDEAILMHAGYVGFISKISGASEILLYGDSKQIPYIERSKIKVRWHHISVLSDPVPALPISMRCPVDVCYLLSRYYCGMNTTSRKVCSILPTLSNGEFYQLQSDTLVLTFTQNEKKLICNALKNKCKQPIQIFTIHEAQGLTAKRVVLIRINTKPLEIYNSEPHVIVALSRHTDSFIYITTGEPDLILTMTRTIQHKNESFLRKWHQEAISSLYSNLVNRG